MLTKQDNIIVFVTASGKEEAERISKELLEKKLAACCNLVSQVNSIYRWKGSIQNDEETLIIIKTSQDKFPQLEKYIVSVHSYEVPEIIAISIIAGHQPYLNWINEETNS